jgi:hypothetical protein
LKFLEVKMLLGDKICWIKVLLFQQHEKGK